MTKYELYRLDNTKPIEPLTNKEFILATVHELGTIRVHQHGFLYKEDIPALIKWIQENFIDELPKKCEPL